ncbi:hypothetical protein G6F22_021754 [Rhizopus arrhizus]|nr:hypothetical protein G6F22_021754 [Rhizopus arrhizus]
MADLRGDAHVLQYRHFGKDLGDLEASADTDATAMAWKMSGQDVEQGCLACAVGADQAIDSARLEGIAEILDGAQRT